MRSGPPPTNPATSPIPNLQASCDAIVGHYHAILTDAFNERIRQAGG